MIDLLTRLLDGSITSDEALKLRPDTDDPTDDKHMNEAWYQLNYYHTDSDIRAYDKGYEAMQIQRLRNILTSLRELDNQSKRGHPLA